jgi:uncharacterized NAD(P)/FAD-binding protein YdhS
MRELDLNDAVRPAAAHARQEIHLVEKSLHLVKTLPFSNSYLFRIPVAAARTFTQ